MAASFGPEARFLAGGTDLIIQINRKRCAPQHLIALDRIGGLSGIDAGEREIRIGALTTHKTIERHPAFSGSLRALAEAARVIGGHQVRNIGTIGGNVVNASPAADLLPVLLVLDAQVMLGGSERTRQIPLAAFLSGPGTTTRRPDELLSHVTFACAPTRSTTAFIKAGRRRAMEISVVCVAASLILGQDGRCRSARIGLGAVGPTALRATAAEQMLQGNSLLKGNPTGNGGTVIK